MKIFDCGFQSDGCSDDDLLNLQYFGTSHALSVGVSSALPATVNPAIDSLARFVALETSRLESSGLVGSVALGIWGALPKRIHDEFWTPFSDLLSRDEVRAVGFIGVGEDRADQWRVFEKQLDLAAQSDLPVLVKAEGPMMATHTYSAMRRVIASGVDPGRCAVRVTDARVVEAVLEEGFVALLSLGSGHLTPDGAAEICAKFACHKRSIVLGSGVRAESGDVLALPKLVIRLREHELDVETISMIAYENAEKFLGLPKIGESVDSLY